MSPRYTTEATMDEPALRDVEHWKDKIEVRLDNRQVFFLFFGSAMVACMLFVLGVIVGKRLESRGRAEAPAMEDPLATLDRFGGVAAPAPAPTVLTFPRALIGGGPSKNRPSSAERTERAERGERADRTERLALERVAAKPILTAAAPLPIGPPTPPSSMTISKKLAALPRPAVAAPSPPSKSPPLAQNKEPSQPTKLAAAMSKPGVVSTTIGDKGRGRFLLQLSSFQDRADADAFARRFAAQNAYVVSTEIPGKGTWYRVRVGTYANLQEASVAKATFEREHNVIAYVAGGGSAK